MAVATPGHDAAGEVRANIRCTQGPLCPLSRPLTLLLCSGDVSMRDLLLMRRPLPRRVLVTAHLSIQLGLLVAATGWTLQHLTPIGPDNSLLAQWPVLSQGVGGFLLAFVLT